MFEHLRNCCIIFSIVLIISMPSFAFGGRNQVGDRNCEFYLNYITNVPGTHEVPLTYLSTNGIRSPTGYSGPHSLKKDAQEFFPALVRTFDPDVNYPASFPLDLSRAPEHSRPIRYAFNVGMNESIYLPTNEERTALISTQGGYKDIGATTLIIKGRLKNTKETFLYLSNISFGNFSGSNADTDEIGYVKGELAFLQSQGVIEISILLLVDLGSKQQIFYSGALNSSLTKPSHLGFPLRSDEIEKVRILGFESYDFGRRPIFKKIMAESDTIYLVRSKEFWESGGHERNTETFVIPW